VRRVFPIRIGEVMPRRDGTKHFSMIRIEVLLKRAGKYTSFGCNCAGLIPVNTDLILNPLNWTYPARPFLSLLVSRRSCGGCYIQSIVQTHTKKKVLCLVRQLVGPRNGGEGYLRVDWFIICYLDDYSFRAQNA
jgi:hypothetical protein